MNDEVSAETMLSNINFTPWWVLSEAKESDNSGAKV